MKGKKLAGEGIRYLIAGFISMAASWAAMWLADQVLFNGTVRPSPAQNAILGLANWTAGMLAAYVLNRKFVFRSSGPVLPELWKHTASRLGTLALDQAVRQAAAAAGLTLYPATLAALCAVTIANYAVGKLLVSGTGRVYKITQDYKFVAGGTFLYIVVDFCDRPWYHVRQGTHVRFPGSRRN